MDQEIFQLKEEVRRLERSGRFTDACQRLEAYWPEITSEPDVNGLSSAAAAHVLLRCGSLIGFLGHVRQIPTAQERSKALLTHARTRFLTLKDVERIAECENYIALAYWRTGEVFEAQSWVEESLSHDQPPSSDTHLYSQVIRNLIFLSQRRLHDVNARCRELEPTFLEYADNFLAGSFYMNYATAAHGLGDVSASLSLFEKARDYFEMLGHKIQIALVENNLSQLFRTENRFFDAHASVDRAVQLFREIGDRTREGFSLDTKAMIYVDEGDIDSALKTIDLSLSILGRSENYAYLVEAISTKSRILLRKGDFLDAVMVLTEAIDLAKVRISEEFARRQVSDFEEVLKDYRIEKSENHQQKAGELFSVKEQKLSEDKNFSSCFISYSSKNVEFVEKLKNDLIRNGVKCWFAPEHLKTGDKIRNSIDDSIRGHDRLLLVLSKHSVESEWVEKEVETALERERKEKRSVLFPIRIDDAVIRTESGWAADIRRSRHIGDFKKWKDSDVYQKALGRLLNDLQGESARE